jgi:integrase
LRTLFSKLEPNADAFRAYLRTAPFLDEDTIHREPFTEEELAAVLEAARGDAVLSGPIIVAVCTAMRRGDCCLLKWRSVDLSAGFIEVKTSKTGETAEIPIMPLLRAEIEPRDKGDGKGYVFPEAAALYENDHPALDRRLRAILARAGFVDDRRPAGGGVERPDLPELPTEELRRRGLEAITRADMAGKRRERMAAIFEAYLEGKGLPTIARELGVSKSTVSLHLNEVERLTGAAVLRRPAMAPAPEVVRGTMHAEAGGRAGRNRVNVRGWHSLRTTWITRALAAGMPEELVRRVTGHSGVDVVRKHYFRPDRADFAKAFEKAMPGLAMNGAGAARSRDERLAEIVEGMNARNWRGARKALLALLQREQERKG